MLLYAARAMFQFTHPGRGATRQSPVHPRKGEVSIHAPREGCDPSRFQMRRTRYSFNSRTPGGVRRQPCRCAQRHIRFNSRTPGGVRRALPADLFRDLTFQFTHPGRGATPEWSEFVQCQWRFNSRTPGGVRRLPLLYPQPPKGCFNSRTPGGVRRSFIGKSVYVLLFQFTHPGRGATPSR